MDEFLAMADELKEVMNNMVIAIEGISSGIEESANAVTISAQSTTELVQEMNSIDDEMGASKNIATSLTQQTSLFKVF